MGVSGVQLPGEIARGLDVGLMLLACRHAASSAQMLMVVQWPLQSFEQIPCVLVGVWLVLSGFQRFLACPSGSGWTCEPGIQRYRIKRC